MKTINVVAAVIISENKVFATQRGYGDFKGGWEFPGGKLEVGETLQEALAREFMEEFGKEITVGDKFAEYTYTYENLGEFRLNAFWAFAENDTIPELNEHMAYKWISPAEMDELEFCPADLPFIEKLKSLK